MIYVEPSHRSRIFSIAVVLTFGAIENLTLMSFYDCWNNLLPHMKQPYLFSIDVFILSL